VDPVTVDKGVSMVEDTLLADKLLPTDEDKILSASEDEALSATEYDASNPVDFVNKPNPPNHMWKGKWFKMNS